MRKKILILHNEVLTNNPDELDVMNQVALVKETCNKLGHQAKSSSIGNNMLDDFESAISDKPDIVFNLVEAGWGKGELIYVVPGLINAYKIPYTGVPLDALFITTNKVLAKKYMQLNGLPTAPFFSINEIEKLDTAKQYIVKPIWEEASVGITVNSIFRASDKNKTTQIKQLPAPHYFIEEFIDGREFNISILASDKGCEVLPPAELIFDTYFKDKPKIVGYDAKWNENSPEYKNTNRAFGTIENKPALKDKLTGICKKTWEVFNLKGYARIDFRLDESENIFILEINGNPCIAPDSGFIAALQYAGYSNQNAIERILNDLN